MAKSLDSVNGSGGKVAGSDSGSTGRIIRATPEPADAAGSDGVESGAGIGDTPHSDSGNTGHGEGEYFVNPESGARILRGTPDAEPKRRGRPPGSRNRNSGSDGNASSRKRSQTTQDLTQLLYSLHLVGSKMLKVEEMEIDEAEAKKLSDAITRVTDLYDIPIPSEKVMAWVMLGKVGIEVYGPRMAAVAIRRKIKPQASERTPAKPPASGAVPRTAAPSPNWFANIETEPVMN